MFTCVAQLLPERLQQHKKKGCNICQKNSHPSLKTAISIYFREANSKKTLWNKIHVGCKLYSKYNTPNRNRELNHTGLYKRLLRRKKQINSSYSRSCEEKKDSGINLGKAGIETDDFLILLRSLANIGIKISLHFMHEELLRFYLLTVKWLRIKARYIVSALHQLHEDPLTSSHNVGRGV